ncbi:hypothetical protein DEU73_115129 [Paenibacillus taichungensis]|nr:hypothetical protein DEU73_115129 [Paenibacillus taichungensis]
MLFEQKTCTITIQVMGRFLLCFYFRGNLDELSLRSDDAQAHPI